MKMIDPARSDNMFIRPQKGRRFVALRLELANMGDVVYKDSPSNGAVVLDSKSQQYNATIGGIKPDIGTPTIAVGDKRVGFLSFEVPKAAKIRIFQLTLDSGFGPEAGEWRL